MITAGTARQALEDARLRLRARLREESDGAVLLGALTDEVERMVIDLAAPALSDAVPHAGRLVLLAVGALARRELAPHSDLDLVLLTEHEDDPAAAIDEVARRVAHPLWDAGLRPNLVVHTPAAWLAGAVDDLTLDEDSHAEILDGERVMLAMGANPPHAFQHFDLTRLLAAHVASGYQGAVDMLTRTDQDNEFAPDVSVCPAGKDPATGGRYLEELAFEIVDTSDWTKLTDKTRKLKARGVRRVFAIDVNDRDPRCQST